MNLLQLYNGGLEKICARPPIPPAAWIHQIHTTGGVSGSTTMVMVFVMLFVLFVRSCLVVMGVGRCIYHDEVFFYVVLCEHHYRVLYCPLC
jgi:hypothetical protein